MTTREHGISIAYPSLNDEQMTNALNIQPDELVLDIGGGGAPFTRANYVIERFLMAASDRDNLDAPVDERWIAGDVQALPFANKSFDVAYCTHVLEHVEDPAKACEELMRVAKRGYIETPRKITEYLHGHPTHRWLIDVIDGVLIFERRNFIESPMKNIMLASSLKDHDVYHSFLVDQRHTSCVQFEWHGSFQYRVIEPNNWQAIFDYNNPIHCGWSHYYFALNLYAQSAPLDYLFHHAKRAHQLLPEETLTCLLLRLSLISKATLTNPHTF